MCKEGAAIFRQVSWSLTPSISGAGGMPASVWMHLLGS